MPDLRRLAKRARLLVSDPGEAIRRGRIRAEMAWLRQVNRRSRRPVTGDGPVTVNLTTFGHRLATVFYTLETIAAGSVRPRRLILWLDEADALAALPAELERLQARGLEVLPCENYGPHKKQYAYALLEDLSVPLAAADDDVLYPADWLSGLLAAYRTNPDAINGYRARTIALTADGYAPYATWPARTSDRASFAAICTGVSGIVYPPALLAALRTEGEGFRQQAPRADDIWVHAVAVRHGIRTRQLHPAITEFPAVPGTQLGTLYRRNVLEGGNDAQVATTHDAAITAAILAEPDHA